MGQPQLRGIERMLISPEEREKRQTAANFALASVGLEGYQVTDAYKAQLERFINGEIDFAELIKAAREHT